MSNFPESEYQDFLLPPPSESDQERSAEVKVVPQLQLPTQEERDVSDDLARFGLIWSITQVRAVFFQDGRLLYNKLAIFLQGCRELKQEVTGIGRFNVDDPFPVIHPSYVLENGMIMYHQQTYPTTMKRPPLAEEPDQP